MSIAFNVQYPSKTFAEACSEVKSTPIAVGMDPAKFSAMMSKIQQWMSWTGMALNLLSEAIKDKDKYSLEQKNELNSRIAQINKKSL